MSESTKPTGSFDVQSLLQALLRYRWLVLALVTLGTVAAALYSMRLPRIYEARSTLEYDPNPIRPLGREVEDVADPVGSFWASREFFETQNRIIASRAVAERVVTRLGLQHDRVFFGESEAEFEPREVEETALRLRSMISVEPVEGTRLVQVVVQHVEPERAKILANEVSAAYIDKTIEDRMGSTVTALDWLGQQLDQLRGELNDAELALHSFKEEHNILSVSMEDRQNLVASEMEAYNAALTEVRTRRINLAARAQRLRAALSDDPLEADASVLEGMEGIAELRQGLREKLAEREALSTRYGPAHPQMAALSNQISELRTQLSQELAMVAASAEADLTEARRIEQGLGGALDEAHEAGLALNLREIEYERLNRERENKAKLYEVVLARTTETNLTRMLRSTHVRQVDSALTPSAPVSPNVPMIVGAGVVLGLLLGLMLALGLTLLDRRLKTLRDVESLGATVLGILPRIDDETAANMQVDRDLLVHQKPMSTAAECARTIRTNLMFMNPDSPPRSLLVTSPTPRDGKTTVATSLAISIAQSGRKVLLIDTDLRRPRVHKAFEIPGSIGATSVIIGEKSLGEAASPTMVAGLDVLPCGPIPPNPSELLHGRGFQRLLAEAREKYDRVILDSPPIGAVTDAAIIAPQVDGVIVVVKANRTTRDGLVATVRQLSSVGSVILGSVVNDVDLKASSHGGYYQYYRYDYYGPEVPAGDGQGEAA
ncbi:MAG: capsular biosynthesis protein [Sandaracinus sp.]|nr:capsular biosynthesis protein [Sandaracinus sp.]